MTTLATLGNSSNTRHLYEIGVGEMKHEGTVEVHANNRAQAARIAEKAGYVVRDVNMVG